MNIDELNRRKKLILELMSDPIYTAMKIKELAVFLDIPLSARHELKAVLEELVYEGKIKLSTNGRYSKINVESYVGVYTANARGFGFVKVEGLKDDIFIPAGEEKNALSGDTVRVEVNVYTKLNNQESGRRTEGSVSEVLTHANKYVVGIYKKNKSFGFVLPDNQKILKDIFIPKGKDRFAKNLDKVVAEIYDYGHKNKKPEARIVEILGKVNEAGVDILSIAKSYGLSMEFEKDTLNEAKKVSEQDISEEYKKRLDLREEVIVTIDSEDAKDLDDAVSLKHNGKNFELGVHIADVSHYIKEKGLLDKEALKRGTSVYLVDRVIPMFPESISNGCCSLNALEDKLTLSCIMEIDDKGRVVSHKIVESIINVNMRMAYSDVAKILKNDNAEGLYSYEHYVDLLKDMEKLAAILRKKREARGSIDFDIPESKISLDKNGKVIDVKAYQRNVATNIIEEFMLITNETVAQEYFWLELPFVYRVHDKPDPDKMKELSIFINNFGFSLKPLNNEIHSKELQKLLNKIKDTNEEALISRITLRNMKQAKYSPDCSEHFGLAAKYYTHFTSPIRRYPDLQIHRIIKENLNSGISDRRLKHYENILEEVCKQSSQMERRADEVERETDKYKKCEYMLRFLGDEFSGVISGVNAHSIYVELENTIEGMVRLSDLRDDYYEYIEKEYAVVGMSSGKTYKLGQRVEVCVERVDKLIKTIDFIMLS